MRDSLRSGIRNLTREQILDEIKRTAAANGGKALGAARFQKETGVTSWDWQKYWPRFGDAVREAGHIPRPFSMSYDEGALLREYIALVRELGRLPARGDLVVKAHAQPGFPCHLVFDRWGEKAKLIERVANYCRERQGFEDVIGLCEAYTPRRRIHDYGATGKKPAIGFVYLIKCGRFYKIGKTNAIGRRQYELRIQLPDKVVTVHVIETDDPSGIETYWHNRFRDKRQNGEWFDLSPGDIAAFRRWRRVV